MRLAAPLTPAQLAATSMGATGSAAGNSLMTCSPHSETRAHWLRGLNGKDETIEILARYADILLLKAEEKPGPTDWAMPTDFGKATAPPSLRSDRDALVLDAMTGYAAQEYSSGQLPVCAEDLLCRSCTHLLRENL